MNQTKKLCERLSLVVESGHWSGLLCLMTTLSKKEAGMGGKRATHHAPGASAGLQLDSLSIALDAL